MIERNKFMDNRSSRRAFLKRSAVLVGATGVLLTMPSAVLEAQQAGQQWSEQVRMQGATVEVRYNVNNLTVNQMKTTVPPTLDKAVRVRVYDHGVVVYEQTTQPGTTQTQNIPVSYEVEVNANGDVVGSPDPDIYEEITLVPAS